MNNDPVPAAWGAPATRSVSWFDPMATAELGRRRSGLAFLLGLRDGEFPPPPIASLLNFAIREVGLGRVVFECHPDESVYNPIGMVHGGLVCTLADTVVGCAVHSTLELGFTYTSLDLTVSYLRPVTIASGVLVATGVVTKPGRRVAFATAEIADGAGRLVATASGSCLVMETPADSS